MLRVVTHHDGDRHSLELQGTLRGEWVPLLERHWRAIAANAASTAVTVVLSDVDFIDPDGERLLRRMADAGVQFVVSGCMNRYVVERLQPNASAVKARA